MKTKVLLAVTLLAGLAASAQAATIVGTKHDLSMSNNAAGTIHSTTQNQTCVFCHAPHNAITNKLLWNRNYLAGSGMKIYTSFNTSAMRTALGATNNSLGDDSSSLLCLSCHSIATGSAATIVTNTANNKGGTDSGNVGAWATVTGGMSNLTNDHPVGIAYDAAITPSAGGLKAVATVTSTTVTATDGGLRLFKSSVGGSNTMECASCHSVHDNANTKFLAKSNANSGLCVTCHIK